ncbi:hypothetical protein BC936DRAFT_138185 [Jimgerdemannia flammicorona]|uniref:Uncharacterized protein n=1 Tax=Jimgerdemannia flammicorona TaxID=994334 RepID=A0A433DII0_9FUNG|nr:hypothetical protein BC936DRAFT_138185 [Jimgerdemannia flammicorona]
MPKPKEQPCRKQGTLPVLQNANGEFLSFPANLSSAKNSRLVPFSFLALFPPPILTPHSRPPFPPHQPVRSSPVSKKMTTKSPAASAPSTSFMSAVSGYTRAAARLSAVRVAKHVKKGGGT